MKKTYTILIYNFHYHTWEQVYTTDNINLAKLKYRQYVMTYKYHNYILREVVVIVE